jgi:hypothetical protein
MSKPDAIDYAAALASAELERAMARFAPLNSAHEGIAVIREEYLELERHVFADTGLTQPAAVEAIQLAAMAMRYVIDLFSTAPRPQ